MKVIRQYKFQLERNGRPILPEFWVNELEDGSVQVSSIHPYDETRYHWASKSAGQGHWSIIRNGQVVSTIGRVVDGSRPLTPEEVAPFLLLEDKKAQLKRTGGIW